jgi:hypothetical protein
MEGKCYELFEKVARIHSQAHVVAQVWNAWDIDASRRQESLELMRRRGEELVKTNQISSSNLNKYFGLLDELDQLNKQDENLHPGMVKKIENITAELAVDAIADCECHREIDTLSAAEKAQIKLDVMTPSRMGAIRG